MGDKVILRYNGKYLNGRKQYVDEDDVLVFLADGREVGRAEVVGYPDDRIAFDIYGDVDQPLYNDHKGRTDQEVVFDFDEDNVEVALLSVKSIQESDEHSLP